MYTALGLTSLNMVISDRKLRWAGWARETHGLVEAPSQVPHVVGRRTSLQRRVHSYRHNLTHELQLIGLNLGRRATAARRLAELGGRSS
jgi:hypothetical protein